MQLFTMPIDYCFFIALLGFAIMFNPIGHGREDNRLMRDMQGKQFEPSTLGLTAQSAVFTLTTNKQGEKMIKRTFLNNNSKGDLADIGLSALRSVQEDLEFWSTYGTDLEYYEDQNRNSDPEIVARFKDLGDFFNYGLSFEFIPASTESDGYFCHLISWGGPSTEIRFHQHYTEFVYMDWFCAVGFNVTNESGFDWARDWFDGCDSLRFKDKEAEDLYSIYHSPDTSEDDE